MYGHWASMELVSARLTVTTVNLLPVERGPIPPTEEQLRAQKQDILDNIVNRNNGDLEKDSEAMKLVYIQLSLLVLALILPYCFLSIGSQAWL